MLLLLGSELDDAVIFAGRLDHPPAFDDIVAGGLLDVNILAGLAGKHSQKRMPVVGRGDRDGVDRLVVEQAAKVFLDLRRLSGRTFDGLHGLGEHRIIDVADRDDLGLRVSGKHLGMIESAVAQTDDGDAHPLAGGCVSGACTSERKPRDSGSDKRAAIVLWRAWRSPSQGCSGYVFQVGYRR